MHRTFREFFAVLTNTTAEEVRKAVHHPFKNTEQTHQIRSGRRDVVESTIATTSNLLDRSVRVDAPDALLSIGDVVDEIDVSSGIDVVSI
jgi:hypothetical protein